MSMSEEEKAQALKFDHDSIHRNDDLKRLITCMPPLHVYRTPPDENNRVRLSCMTMSMRANEDLRSYLVVNSNNSLEDVPEDVLTTLPGLELWKENQDPVETLYFFDRYYEAGYYDETKLIVDRGWLQLKNNMGWGWSIYQEQKEREERWNSLTEEEKQKAKERSRNKFAEAAGLAIDILHRDQWRAIKDGIRSWFPWNWFRKLKD